MPILSDVLAGSLAQAAQVQQIIDALKGTPSKGVPVALVSLNDANNYALSVQNDDATNSRALSVLKADGSTLISADITGVTLGSPLHLAAGSLNVSAIPDGSITSAKITDGTIQGIDIADGTITTSKIGAQQVATASIAPAAVNTGQLANQAVTTPILADAAVTTVKIGAQQVATASIAPNAVGTGQIAANAATLSTAVFGTTANPTTTSTTLVDMPDMTLNIGTIGGDLLIWLMATVACSASGATLTMQLNIDATDIGQPSTVITATANQQLHLGIAWRIAAPSVTTHTIKGRWSTSAGTATAIWQYRSLVALEVRR